MKSGMILAFLGLVMFGMTIFVGHAKAEDIQLEKREVYPMTVSIDGAGNIKTRMSSAPSYTLYTVAEKDKSRAKMDIRDGKLSLILPDQSGKEKVIPPAVQLGFNEKSREVNSNLSPMENFIGLSFLSKSPYSKER